MKLNYLVLASVSGFCITIDQLTKIYIHTQFRLGETFPVIAGYFHLTYVRNPGAAFGFMAEADPGFRSFFFSLVAPLAVLFILLLVRSLDANERVQTCALSLIAGGAIGNYIDRLRLGYVIDFLDLHYKTWSWPAFNLADCSIVLGVGVLFILLLIETLEEWKISSEPQSKSNLGWDASQNS